MLAAFLLHWRTMLFPMMLHDDFANVMDAYPASSLQKNLWTPHNEHAMPLGRLLTFVLAHIAGSASALPWVLTMLGPLVLLSTMGLIYLFVRREMDALSGLIAMAIYGLTSQHHESVFWFAAVFFMIAFATAMLALLCAQWWIQKGSLLALPLCALFCAAAPAWNSVGLFAAPVCAVYLFLHPYALSTVGRVPDSSSLHSKPPLSSLAKRFLIAFVPILGVGLFLALNLTRNADQIMHTGHYGDKTMLQSIKVIPGVIRTVASLFDQLLIGTLGYLYALVFLEVPMWVSAVLGIPVVIALFLWFRRCERRDLFLVGLTFILANNLLIHSARVDWSYERMRDWGRYNVFPHFGLALILLSGLGPWLRRWKANPRVPTWSLVVLGLVLVPHAISCSMLWYDKEQSEQLARIDRMDRLLRERQISRELAIEVLPELKMIANEGGRNGWELLRGSDNPKPISKAEAKRILLPFSRDRSD